MIESLRAALLLLDRRSRFRLMALVAIQVILALLDLVGVALLGLVVSMAASSSANANVALIPPILVQATRGISLVGLLLLVALIFLAKSVLSFLVMQGAYRFLARKQATVSGNLGREILALPLLSVRRHTTQEVSYALTQGVNAAVIGILGSAVVIASELAVLVVLFVGMTIINAVVAIFTVFFFGITALIVYRLVGLWGYRSGEQLSAIEVESVESIQNVLHTYREFIVFGRRGHFVEMFRGMRTQASVHQANMQILGQLSKYVFEFALIVGTAMLAGLLYLTEGQELLAATLAMFLAVTSRVSPSLLRTQQAALSLRNSSGMAEPTFALVEGIRKDSQGAISAQPLPVSKGNLLFVPAIEIHEVTLKYPDSLRPALKNVSLRIEPGTSLAVTGSSGAGKSTLVDVMLGILEPDDGWVKIGGLRPSDAIDQWTGAIAYVPQDVTLVRGTVRENVALGLPPESINDIQVWSALERAQLSETIRESSKGVYEEVGERGVRLSGGQRQRLGLARAFYSNPRLIVLDEATSALDSETEFAVTKALENVGSEVTVVVIAHRLATVRHSDQVAYLEFGKLLAIGGFDEVRKRVPSFDRQAGLLGL